MDNLSHTLIGVLVGEAVSRTVGRTRAALPDPTRRNLIVGLMAVGSNFPDLDFIYSSITGIKLDYLLHHRGHTHTVIGAVLIAAFLFACVSAWIRARKLQVSRDDNLILFGAALLAPLLHIAMDFANSYGVHPFWPLDNRWMYGDSIFIVEPLFWAAAAPLVFVLRTLVARALVVLALLSGIGLSFGMGMVPTGFAVALTAIIALLLVIGRVAPAGIAVASGLFVWMTTLVGFAIASRAAAADIRALSQEAANAPLIDHVLTPMPVNPLCWDVIAINADATSYALTRATLSLAPNWIRAVDCPVRSNQTITAPLTPVRHPGNDAIHWRGEIVLSIAELQALAAAHCQVVDLLRFARAPFFFAHEQGMLVGDLRYDHEPQPDFAETLIERDRCPAYAPEWIPPRSDLLR